MHRRGLYAAAIGPLLAYAAPYTVQAQQDQGAQLELRADLIAARNPAMQIAGGASWIAGTYVRLAALVGAGIGEAPRTHAVQGSARADLLLRFTLDPMRQSRWGLYGASGLGALYDPAREWRGVLMLALGVEGPRMGGLVPAFEIGVGGGVRAGVIVRRARHSFR